jgi:hypothetical protein
MEIEERDKRIKAINLAIENADPDRVNAFPELFALVKQLAMECEYEDISNQTLIDTIHYIKKAIEG